MTDVTKQMAEALEWFENRRNEAETRASAIRNAPEDAAVMDLCRKYGFGAVMDSAARQWATTDKTGAFFIGGCIGDTSARAALAAYRAAPSPDALVAAGWQYRVNIDGAWSSWRLSDHYRSPSKAVEQRPLYSGEALDAAIAAAVKAERERWQEAMTLIERIYYMEGKDAAWRAARMNAVARAVQEGDDLASFRRLFPRNGPDAILAGDTP